MNKIKFIEIKTVFTLLFVVPLSCSYAQGPSSESSTLSPTKKKEIKAIEIHGNKAISLTAILSRIKSRVGQEYRENVISDDIKRLYNTGYFSDVSVERQEEKNGFRVMIYVVEKSIVEEITFSKMRYFKTRTLLNKMQIKTGQFWDQKMLKDDIKMIEELYAKKGLTVASVDTETSVDKVTNKAKLHFIIQEGHRVKIKKITVGGNSTISDKQIYRVINTRSAWLFNSGYLREEILDEDMERIAGFYAKEGFVNAVAQYTVNYFPNRKQYVDINITVNEGERYYVGDITITGNLIVLDQEIISAIKELKKGEAFSQEKLETDLSKIQSLYFDRGYIFAKIDESTSLNPKTGEVEIKLVVEEGRVAYVNKVKIEGNTLTRDIVIRRELKIYPGEEFDGNKLRRSKQQLNNLGYFEEVDYDIEDTEYPDRKDLVVQVKEAKTGSFSFGGGYSTVDKVVGFIEIEQKNFDFTNWPTFTGGGQDLLLRAETGSTRNNLRLSFTEPWIFDYPISGGFDAYSSEKEKERDVGYAYDEKRVGGDVRFGKKLSDYLSAGTIFRHEEITIDSVEEDATDELKKEVGKNTVNTLGFTLTRDTRDNIFNPTDGLLLGSSYDLAGGFLGGDKDFYRAQSKLSYNVPLRYNSVLEFRMRVGVIDTFGSTDDVPIFERFFAGGVRTIRGYDERKVGPLDEATKDPIGGESLLTGNVEYTIPVIEVIKLAAFFDVGNVWPKVSDLASGGFKSGAGLGLRIKTPVGPINLDYGYPLDDEPGEESRSGKFYFSVSRGF